MLQAPLAHILSALLLLPYYLAPLTQPVFRLVFRDLHFLASIGVILKNLIFLNSTFSTYIISLSGGGWGGTRGCAGTLLLMRPKYAIVPEYHEFLYINYPYQKPQSKQLYTPHMYKYTLSFIIPSNFQGSIWGLPHPTRTKKNPVKPLFYGIKLVAEEGFEPTTFGL